MNWYICQELKIYQNNINDDSFFFLLHPFQFFFCLHILLIFIATNCKTKIFEFVWGKAGHFFF